MLHSKITLLAGAGLVTLSTVIAPIALDPQTGLPEIKAAQAQGQGGGQGSGGGNSGQGKGNSGQGAGNGSQAGSGGGSSGASGDSNSKGNASGNQSGHVDHGGAAASLRGSLNAAHASETALGNASSGSTVGLIANYKDAITAVTELEVEINTLNDTIAELEALAGTDTTELEASIDQLEVDAAAAAQAVAEAEATGLPADEVDALQATADALADALTDAEGIRSVVGGF